MNRRISRTLWLLTFVAPFLACAVAPISMQVQAGSTVMIALPDDDPYLSAGFGSEVTKMYGDYDDQRGEIVFDLQDPLGVLPNYRLRTRYVTRVFPDSSIPGPYGGQLMALVDVPLPTDSPAGPNVSSAKQFSRRRQAWRSRVRPHLPGRQSTHHGCARVE